MKKVIHITKDEIWNTMKKAKEKNPHFRIPLNRNVIKER